MGATLGNGALRMTTTSLCPGVSVSASDDPRRYHRARRFWRWVLRRVGLWAFARVERVEGLEHVPARGPAIVYYNHIAFTDPIILLGYLPLATTPLAKVEAFHYPLIGYLPRWWGAIPVHRGETDKRAIRLTLAALAAGEVILIAPEGTRNPTLQRAKPGLAYFALRCQAPLIPAAVDGTEGYPTLPLLPRWWRKPWARVRFGRPFRLRGPRHARTEVLQAMADEAMYILADLLPPERRGVYAQGRPRVWRYVEWL